MWLYIAITHISILRQQIRWAIIKFLCTCPFASRWYASSTLSWNVIFSCFIVSAVACQIHHLKYYDWGYYYWRFGVPSNHFQVCGCMQTFMNVVKCECNRETSEFQMKTRGPQGELPDRRGEKSKCLLIIMPSPPPFVLLASQTSSP